MKIRILGSAAGGGFPQWNCNCRNCRGLRDGSLRVQARTQSSIAVSANGVDWLLINASPDILAQIRANPPLQPARALRDTGIRAVLLMDGQVDHVTGLAMLREHRQLLPIWCTDAVHADLTIGYPLFGVLAHFCGVERQTIPIDGSSFRIAGLDGLTFAAVPVSSKAAPYSPHRNDPQPGDNIGLLISDADGRSLFYAPGLGAIEPPVWAAMQDANAVLVDGTFWSDNEMIELGISTKSARSIGHLPQAGEGGMIEHLRRLSPGTRKLLIHINNTNPILDEDSAERAELARRGIEVTYDGMEFVP
jgi:pyrroloquinoline quinone biosynthesis protein B